MMPGLLCAGGLIPRPVLSSLEQERAARAIAEAALAAAQAELIALRVPCEQPPRVEPDLN
jgi:hypothetical protein